MKRPEYRKYSPPGRCHMDSQRTGYRYTDIVGQLKTRMLVYGHLKYRYTVILTAKEQFTGKLFYTRLGTKTNQLITAYY